MPSEMSEAERMALFALCVAREYGQVGSSLFTATRMARYTFDRMHDVDERELLDVARRLVAAVRSATVHALAAAMRERAKRRDEQWEPARSDELMQLADDIEEAEREVQCGE